MKVVVLTTSYPSAEHPVAGNFVASAVEAVRDGGVAVDVVSPDSFPHFGMSTFSGVQQGDGKQNPAIFTPSKFDAAQ